MPLRAWLAVRIDLFGLRSPHAVYLGVHSLMGLGPLRRLVRRVRLCQVGPVRKRLRRGGDRAAVMATIISGRGLVPNLQILFVSGQGVDRLVTPAQPLALPAVDLNADPAESVARHPQSAGISGVSCSTVTLRTTPPKSNSTTNRSRLLNSRW